MPRVSTSALHSLRRVALFLLAAGLRAQSTWNLTPVDNSWATAANWSTGTAPIGISAVAVFGDSTVTSITIPLRLSIGTLQFTSAATVPYVLNFTYNRNDSSTPLRLGSIVNNSSWAPTLTFRDSYLIHQTDSTLADANLVFTGATFIFNGLGGTSTVQMNGGNLYYGHSGGTVDGQSARLILNGGQLTNSNSADVAHFRFGSIEGNGTVFIANAASTLTVGQNNRDATFSGTLSGSGVDSTSTITKTGAGTWTLTATNTSDAAVIVTGGAVAIDTNARLGAGGALTLNGGAVRYTAAFDDLRALSLGASGGSLDTQGFNVVHATSVSGNGLLTKLGSGTLTLSTANTHSAGTILSAGTLAIGHDTALGSGPLTFAGGALHASGGPRTFSNPVTLSSTATLGGSSALTSTGAWTLAGAHAFDVTNSALTTISGAIGETGGARSFTKLGTGTLELTGANTYTGGTLIAAGTVRINNSIGSAFGPGAVTVASGATLTGAGSFSGAFQNNGSYLPGNSPSLETLASFSQGPTGTLVLELGGLTRGTHYDALNITGAAAFDGTLTVTLIDGFNPATGASFNLFDWGSRTGTFATINLPGLSTGLAWNTASLYNDGTLSVSAIPEPSTYALILGSASLGIILLHRRRSASAARR